MCLSRIESHSGRFETIGLLAAWLDRRIIITAGSYAESREALEMARNTRHDVELYSTVGVHPTRANEFRGNSEQVVSDLAETLRDGMSDKKVRLSRCVLCVFSGAVVNISFSPSRIRSVLLAKGRRRR